jgi:hypothetical protein
MIVAGVCFAEFTDWQNQIAKPCYCSKQVQAPTLFFPALDSNYSFLHEEVLSG